MSPKLRFQILVRDRFTCRYCGQKAPTVELHVDHVFPVSRGGTDEENNLVTACVGCNFGKRDTILPFSKEQLIWEERELQVRLLALALIKASRQAGGCPLVHDFNGIRLSVSASDTVKGVLAQWRYASRKAQEAPHD